MCNSVKLTKNIALAMSCLLVGCQLNSRALIPIDFKMQENHFSPVSVSSPVTSPISDTENFLIPTPAPEESSMLLPQPEESPSLPPVEKGVATPQPTVSDAPKYAGTILTPHVSLFSGQKYRLLYRLPNGSQEGIDIQLDGSGRILYIGGLRNGVPLSKGLLLTGLDLDGQRVEMGYINAGTHLNHKIPLESADKNLRIRSVVVEWLDENSLLLEARTF